MEYKLGDYVWLYNGDLILINSISGGKLVTGKLVKDNTPIVAWQQCEFKAYNHVKLKANIKIK